MIEKEKKKGRTMSEARVFAQDLFKGQVVLVSGGGTGIGRAIAEQFASCGATGIVLCGRRREPLDECAAAIGDRAMVHLCDIRVYEQCEAVVEAARARFGRVDVCVNNAGGQFPSLAEAISSKGFAAVINTNLIGTFNMTRAVATRCFIPAQRGRFVNVVANFRNGFPTMSHTGAARAGVDNLTKSLAVEWARFNIQVNAVAPGIITSSGTLDKNRYGSMLDHTHEIIPAGRNGTVREVADLVLFLASDKAAAFVTGQTVYVCGGQSLNGDLWSKTRALIPSKL
jgi:NAD(P)-dependent dehydrogenase (short-subunit alcohol dehydrogenase family)